MEKCVVLVFGKTCRNFVRMITSRCRMARPEQQGDRLIKIQRVGPTSIPLDNTRRKAPYSLPFLRPLL